VKVRREQSVELDCIDPVQGGISDSLLSRAIAIANRSDVSPRDLRRRCLGILALLGVNLVVFSGAVLSLARGWVQTDAAQVYALFVAAGSIIVAFVAVGSLSAVVWSGYVYQYIKALEAREGALEATVLSREALAVAMSFVTDDAVRVQLVKLVLRSEHGMSHRPEHGGDETVLARRIATTPDLRHGIGALVNEQMRARASMAGLDLDELG
jgi:hypothetical protein